MPLNLLTPPAAEPITLQEFRDHAGISRGDDTSRDAVIESRIRAARAYAESYTGIVLVSQTWRYESHCFSDVMLLKHPVQSVTAVRYFDSAGVLQVADSSLYYLDKHDSCVRLHYGKLWPFTAIRNDAVQIEHIAGFGDPTQVPDDIKEAIHTIVGQWENCQGSIESGRVMTVAYAVDQLLDNHKDWRHYFGTR